MLRSLFPNSCKRLRVFISYAAQDKRLALEIAQGLRNRGDTVFVDVDSLLPGSDFNAKIANTIRRSDKFIFVASPESLADGRYTLTELNAAKSRWPSPVGKVLTVISDPALALEELDPYLRSVQVLRPSGNLVAELVSIVDNSRSVGLACRLIGSILVLGLILSLSWLGFRFVAGEAAEVAMMRILPHASIGHYLGAPVVVATFEYENPTRNAKVVSLRQSGLVSPTGSKTPFQQVFTVFNNVPMQAVGVVNVLPNGPPAMYMYDHIAPPREAGRIVQELVRSDPVLQSTMMLPNRPIISTDDADRIRAAVNRDFSWVPGIWAIEVRYQVGDLPNTGIFHTATLEFTVTENEIDQMFRNMNGIEKGAGVLFPIRYYDAYGVSTLIPIIGR